jgi:hypothetical protein
MGSFEVSFGGAFNLSYVTLWFNHQTSILNHYRFQPHDFSADSLVDKYNGKETISGVE